MLCLNRNNSSSIRERGEGVKLGCLPLSLTFVQDKFRAVSNKENLGIGSPLKSSLVLIALRYRGSGTIRWQ